MSIAHYIVFHPDYARQTIDVNATILSDGEIVMGWQGRIHVDQVGEGNEDPFVFHNPWLYSYCHATQLKRKKSTGPYVQPGSVIIFVSGQSADNAVLSVDTVFVVGAARPWPDEPLQLPKVYRGCFEDSDSPLWERHFKFPFLGIHKTVTHTYEAAMWEEGKSLFSFLPLNATGGKASLPFAQLENQLAMKVKGKLFGKRPVPLTQGEMQTVLKQLETVTAIKVLRDVTTAVTVETKVVKC
jgi:hypothetical protein